MGANLWLKEDMNSNLSENSKNIVSKFIKNTKLMLLQIRSEKIFLNI